MRIQEQMNFKKEDKLNYVKKLIEVFSVLKVDKELWLTEVEKDFYATLIILINDKIDLKSEDSMELFSKNVGLKRKSDTSLYLRKMEEKKWIRKSDDKIVIPAIFKNIESGFEFEIKLTIDAN